jgi:uncharacterized protein (DUF1778 family)
MRNLSNRLIINVPDDIRSWIEEAARREDRTMTSVIVRAVKAQMREQDEQREQAVG